LYTTILFAIAVVMQGFDIWKLYVLEIFPRLNYGELHASFSYYFQTFFLFFKMMFVYDELRNPLALYDNYNLFLVSVIFVKAFLMIFTVASTMKNIKNNLYNFSLWLLCALLLLPNSNTYTMIFLMFILFYYIHKYKHQPYIFISLLCIVFYISWVPTFKMMHMPYILRYSKLIFTFLLFIVLIKNEGILIRLKETMAIFLFVIGSSINLLFKERTIKSSYLITKNRPELISQLYLKNNKLNYAYWNLNGEIHDSTDIVSTVKPNDKIELINNQLVLNSKLITQSKDLKKSPLIIGQKIYYLSDLNQGYGFYTIRMLDFVPTN